jgi:hypothetical protein
MLFAKLSLINFDAFVACCFDNGNSGISIFFKNIFNNFTAHHSKSEGTGLGLMPLRCYRNASCHLWSGFFYVQLLDFHPKYKIQTYEIDLPASLLCTDRYLLQ